MSSVHREKSGNRTLLSQWYVRIMSRNWLTQSIEDYSLFCEKEFISSSENKLNWK